MSTMPGSLPRFRVVGRRHRHRPGFGIRVYLPWGFLDVNWFGL